MEDFSSFVEYIKNHDNFKGTITENEPLAPKSTFKIGANARVFVAPDDYFSFQLTLRRILSDGFKFFITGGASNLVFPDEDFDGIILSSQNFNDAAILSWGDLRILKRQIIQKMTFLLPALREPQWQLL